MVPLGLFVSSMALSTIFSPNPIHVLVRSTATIFSILIILLVMLVKDKEYWWRVAATIFIIALFLDSIVQRVNGHDLLGHPLVVLRTDGFMPHPNDIAIVSILLPFVGWWVWPFGFATLAMSQSRNALLGFVVVVMLLSPYKKMMTVMAGALVTFITWTHAAYFTSLFERVGHWMVALFMWTKAPWLGLGPFTFVDYYLSYINMMTPLPWRIRPEIGFVPWAHSLFFEQFAERGLVGFIVFCILITLTLKRGRACVRASLLALLVMGLVDLSFIKPWVTFTFLSLTCLGDSL